MYPLTFMMIYLIYWFVEKKQSACTYFFFSFCSQVLSSCCRLCNAILLLQKETRVSDKWTLRGLTSWILATAEQKETLLKGIYYIVPFFVPLRLAWLRLICVCVTKRPLFVLLSIEQDKQQAMHRQMEERRQQTELTKSDQNIWVGERRREQERDRHELVFSFIEFFCLFD